MKDTALVFFRSPLLLLFAGGVALTVGDIIAAKWVHEGGNLLYFVVMSCYLVGMMFLLATYRREDIAVASTILVIMNVSILAVVGVVFYGEGLSFNKIFGLLMGMGAIVLFEVGKFHQNTPLAPNETEAGGAGGMLP